MHYVRVRVPDASCRVLCRHALYRHAYSPTCKCWGASESERESERERERERERENEIMSFVFVSVPVTGMGALMKEGRI